MMHYNKNAILNDIITNNVIQRFMTVLQIIALLPYYYNDIALNGSNNSSIDKSSHLLIGRLV